MTKPLEGLDEAIARGVCTALVEQQLSALDPATHPPVDSDSEIVILAAMASGENPPAWLSAEDFFFNLHQAIFAVLEAALDQGATPNAATILRVIELQGFVASRFAGVVENIVTGPVCVLLETPARRVWECARQRRSIHQGRKLERVLLSVPVSVDDAREAATPLWQTLRELAEGPHD